MANELNPSDIHKGHRKRMRNELMNSGIHSGMPAHKVLEYILFHSIPRKDTNEIAHALLKKFGSFSAVLDASPSELASVDGINEASVALIKMIVPIFRYYMADKAEKGIFLKTRNQVGNYILNQYAGYTSEVVALLSTNNLGKVISYDIIGEGDIDSVNASPRKILEVALRTHATAMIISHNHPGGIALPSPNDIATTIEIKNILDTIHVRLLDHIIVCDGDYVSLGQSEKYKYIFEGQSK